MTNDALKKWLIEYVEEVWNKRNYSSLDKYLGTDFKNAFAPQLARGHEGMKMQVEYLHKVFESFHLEVKEIVIENQKISILAEITGKHAGEVFGIKPTGKVVRFREAIWYILKDEKLDEVYPFVDWNAFFVQVEQYPVL